MQGIILLACGRNRAKEDGVIAAAFLVIAPEDAVGEDFKERGDDVLAGVFAAFIEGDPEGHDAAGIQVLLAHLVILDGVEGGQAFDPGIDGVGSDHVKFLVGGADVVAAVVDDDVGLVVCLGIFQAGEAVGNHVVIDIRELGGDMAGDHFFDVHDGDIAMVGDK